jgi:Bacterial lectin/PQQ-like domain/Abnormal spindle-like microcephaly-assoc'd, ASPM-SPD-2-Hydin
MLLLVCAALVLACTSTAWASGVTNASDDLRTGWYPNMGSLTPQLVSGGTFGQMWSTTVEGQVYAQPLLSNGTVLVATEKNKVYGLDPATGALKWAKALNLGTPWNPADISCGDLTPSIGVTSTPVIDSTTNIAYMTHKTYASGTSGPARWYMDAVNMTSGVEEPGFPVEMAGAAQNAPSRTFAPTTQLQRPGLLLMGGVVYAAFGSHCDVKPWQGWIFGVSTAGKVTTRYVDNLTAEGAGIWQSGAGLTSDGPGTILFSTGNGGAPSTPAPGTSPPANLGESIVRVRVQPDGSLKPVDFFAPFDGPSLDSFDSDFASGGVTGLPSEYFGTAAIPHLIVADGKQGYVYLLNRDSLGGVSQGTGGSDNVVQRLGPRGGVWSRPGIWPGDGGYVYIPTSSGSSGGGHLDMYKYGLTGTGLPSLSLAGSSEDAFGWGSGAPVITSEGTNSGSALIWIIWSTNRTGAGGQLRAYDPIPVNGKPVLRFQAPLGTASNYSTPGVGAGKLFVGNREGKVMAFGSPVTPVLSGPATSFPTTTIGSSAQKTLTLTANSAVTITKLSSSSAQYTVGTPSIALPAKLVAGQTIQVPLTFTPAEAGLVGGNLTAETSGGNVSFAFSGMGQTASAQLTNTPPLVTFGGTAVGGHLSGTATFRNIGGAPLTINAVDLPAAPFGATGVPAVGSQLAAGASVTINVTFDPTSEGNFLDEIGLETTGGDASVGLSGSAGQPGVLKVTGESNEFGGVALGGSATRSFTLTNTGGTNVTITKSKPPSGGAFEATTALPEGTTIAPGASVTETVAYKPTAPGYAAGAWTINGDDTTGLHEVTFKGMGTVPAPGSAWSHNGAATITAGLLRTTPATASVAGSGFFTTAMDSRHLVVEFDQTINGGSGADGQALVLADASKATLASLGATGGGLGFSGISGIAVAFDTYKNTVNPSNNFVGITDGPTSAGADKLHWLSTSTTIPALRTATRHVKVEVLNEKITVWMEGTQVLSGTAKVAPRILLGFSGGTGGSTDIHQVANVVVGGDAAPSGPPPPPASLQIGTTVSAPSGSPQGGAQFVVSGSCPSNFTTAALGNGGSATPTLTGAVEAASCSVSEAVPTETGWKTTATVNGAAEVPLTPVGGKVTVPTFSLSAGSNTVRFTNTYTPAPSASLQVGTTVTAPSGSPQASAQFVASGTCPSSFTTAALGNGGSATPTLTGAVEGASCSVSEAVPSETGWKTTATVNGAAEVPLTPISGKVTVPTFLLAAGANAVHFTNTYTPAPPTKVPDPTLGGWQLNGTTTLTATELLLTSTAEAQAGTAFWPQTIDPRNLTIEFDAFIGGGSGADGMALVFADPARGATAKSLGYKGGGLGFGGIPALAVALDTYKNSANPSANFVGITDGPSGTAKDLLHWLSTATLSASLRNVTHHVKVVTAGGMMTVSIDGVQVLSQAVTLPSSAYLGFSGGSGGQTDKHAVTHLVVG